MAKSLKLVSRDTPSPVTVNTDWTKCFLCQQVTDDKLICPVDHSYGGGAYKTLANNLPLFAELGLLPSSITLNRLDNGEGLESTFKTQHAKYHKKCYLKYNEKNLQRANKRKGNEDPEPQVPEKFTRRKSSQSSNVTCIFCNLPAAHKNPLRNASTGDLDTKVRQCAINLQDDNLLAKLSSGDVVAIEMKYHPQCLVNLYNKDRAQSSYSKKSRKADVARNTAFAEMLSYMQEILEDDNTAPVFQLSELTKLYTSRLNELDKDETSAVHATRLKNRILGYFPELEAYHEGRDVLLVTSEIAGQSIRKTCQLDGESETVLMSRVADLIRRDIFSHEYPLFDGSFTEDCQQRSVPQSLLTLMSMILYGSNIKNKNNYQSQAAMSVSQLLVYNSVRSLKSNPIDNRHSKTREPPLPLFVGAYVHSKTRSKDTIDTLHKMGLSVTYDRVLSLSADLANSAIDHFESVGAVCPQSLKIGLFTTSAVDNIDHDPSSTSSQTSFHGTGISIFQHPSVDCAGTD